MRFLKSPSVASGATLILALGLGVVVALLQQGPIPLRAWLLHPIAAFELAQGENPAPVTLLRPQVAPLSAMAQLGRLLFNDPRFSSSGALSCASCHSPAHFYGPPGDAATVRGGPDLTRQGVRAVPSLMYLESQPNFSIGPDAAGDNDAPVPLPQLAIQASSTTRTTKTAQTTAQSAANLVPQGGLFWDGRAETLQQQAIGPMLNPLEIDAGSIARIAAKLRSAPYADRFAQLFGPRILNDPALLVSEAMFAIARYQIEAEDFHPFTSKYDAWLEGRTRLTPAELRGYMLFNDPAKGDCAACHLDQPGPDGTPPLFTDHQYEALGLPRNPKLLANADPAYFDEGLCGPYRSDLSSQTQFCGMFLTPTLRNAAARRVFFHNGVYHSLKEVLDFYDFRDTEPGRIYPKAADGKVRKYDDLPARFHPNIDTADPPFDRHAGEPPALDAAQELDIIAFLETLRDGFLPMQPQE